MILETALVVGALVVGGGAALGWLSSMIYNVKEKQEVLVESFGKYVSSTKSAGLKLKAPWPFQTIATRVPTALMELQENLATKTKDDIFVTLPIKMHLLVEDTKKYHYESHDPIKQVMSRIAATVKQETAKMDFADLYQARQTISDKVRENVGKEIKDLYGVSLIDVIVDEPHAPAEIQSSYNNVKASERNMLATKNNAEANKINIIAEAEARKEAQRLDGEGIAAQRSAIFANYAQQFNKLAKEGLSEDMAHQIITLAMQNDTIRDAAKGGNIIITSANANDVLGQMQALGKSLTKPANHANDDASAPAAHKPPKAG